MQLRLRSPSISASFMGFWITILVLSGFALSAFGAWGKHSEAGQRKYDEMAGMIPYFAWWLGLLFLAVAAMLGLVVFFRK